MSIEKWNEFLKSLATRGGAIFLLLLIMGAIDPASFTIFLLHQMSFEQLKDVVSTSGFASALLISLKATSDSTATATGPSGSVIASTAGIPVPIAAPVISPAPAPVPVPVSAVSSSVIATSDPDPSPRSES